MSLPVACRPAETIGALVAAGHTVADLEAALGLSAGYLSKVRHGVVRPSAQLVALLEVVRTHPETLATVRRATGAPERRSPRPARAKTRSGTALDALLSLSPRLEAAGVRWAVSGAVALAAFWPETPAGVGVDIVVDDRDRHVLQLLREAGHAVAHHPPGLAVARVGRDDPNDGIRVHFPTTPPLSTAFGDVVVRDVAGRALPVVDLATLTLANLLSQRTGAADAVAIGLSAGVSADELDRRLTALEAMPPIRSPYVLRLFDRELARRRLTATSR